MIATFPKPIVSAQTIWRITRLGKVLPALLGALLMHVAFTRADALLAMPLGLACVLATWMSLSPRAAAVIGYLTGFVYFASNVLSFGPVSTIGPFAPLCDVTVIASEALSFAGVATASALAARHLRLPAAAAVAAGAFTLVEYLRSSGPFGLPLYQIGLPFVDSALVALAAFGGIYALTFSVALVSATLAVFVKTRSAATLIVALGTQGVIGVLGYAAWSHWDARDVGAGRTRVAAVQGNVHQSAQWTPGELADGVDRYTRLTRTLRAFKPEFVLWPEMAIEAQLAVAPAIARNPANAALVANDARLDRRFRGLARSLRTVIALGSGEAATSGFYDDLLFYTPGGKIEATYRKRQLVPFADYLPLPSATQWLPFASLVASYSAGTAAGPYDARLRVAPLLGGEANFPDAAADRKLREAKFYAVASSDGRRGNSAGPDEEWQLSRLRAVETGRWVVRAATSGISGIIAPNGDGRVHAAPNAATVVTGTIGEPLPTFYSGIGPVPVAELLTIIVCLAVLFGAPRERSVQETPPTERARMGSARR